MTEEEKIFAGKMFDPRKQELKDLKHKAHEACRKFNMMDEYDPQRQQARPAIFKGPYRSTTAAICSSVKTFLPILI